jgi:hypothetical protein
MRTYKPKKAKATRSARMRHAARLRGEGLSLRQIAAQQGVSHDTVWRDLAAWDAQHARVSDLPVRKTPPGGGNLTPRSDSRDADIVPLRRTGS